MEERPGRLVAEPELALQLHGRQPGGMSGHEVGGPEPYRQWPPRPMQGRARRQGGRPSARLALPQPPVRELEGGPRPASRTAKALWPPASGQVFPTRVVLPESGLELLQGLGKIGPAHLATRPMRSFGVNPIGTRALKTLCSPNYRFVSNLGHFEFPHYSLIEHFLIKLSFFLIYKEGFPF